LSVYFFESSVDVTVGFFHGYGCFFCNFSERLVEFFGCYAKEGFSFAFMLECIDFVYAFAFVDSFPGEIYLFLSWVDTEDFENEFLTFTDVVAYVANPTSADFASVEEPFFVVVFFKSDVSAVVGDFFDCGEDEFASFWPFGFVEERHFYVGSLHYYCDFTVDFCFAPCWSGESGFTYVAFYGICGVAVDELFVATVGAAYPDEV
jgi:hypothetical protein